MRCKKSDGIKFQVRNLLIIIIITSSISSSIRLNCRKNNRDEENQFVYAGGSETTEK